MLCSPLLKFKVGVARQEFDRSSTGDARFGDGKSQCSPDGHYKGLNRRQTPDTRANKCGELLVVRTEKTRQRPA
jgi:hypothetical protein